MVYDRKKSDVHDCETIKKKKTHNKIYNREISKIYDSRITWLHVYDRDAVFTLKA